LSLEDYDEGGLATPKRGLVDGPGSYSQKTGFAINPEGRLKGTKVAKEILDAKKVKTVGHVKELEKWIEANASKYTDVDKFYQAALKKFDKPKYEGLVRGSVQQAKRNVRNPIEAGKHIYIPTVRALKANETAGEIPKGGRYNYKNLFELKGVDAGSKIRYVKDMMLINMLEKNPKLEKFAKNLDKVMLNDTVGMSFNDVNEVKAFTRKHLKATAARPNLFRSYLTNKHKGFEDLRKKQNVAFKGVYGELQSKLNDPNLSDAAKQKVKRTLANMDKSRKYHIQFKNEFPDLFADKKVYDPLGGRQTEEQFDFEHKIGKATTGVNKLPETYHLRGTYVPGSFNQAKLQDFDNPLLTLMNEYRETKNPKIEKQIEDLYKNFNEKSAGYLNDLKIYFDKSTGSVIIDDKTPIYKIKDYADYKQMISKNLKHSQAYLKNFKKGEYAFDDKKLKTLLASIKPTDTKSTILSKIKKAPLPSKVKNVLLGTLGGYGSITGADFLKKTGILFDKEYEQTASVADAPIVEKGLSTGEKAAIGTGTGLGIGTKTGRNILGKTFRTLGTPLSGPLWASLNIYDKMKEGESFGEAVMDPLTGVELAFPSLFTENVAKITKNPTAQRILNLGGLQRVLGPVGTGITTVSSLKDRAKAMGERGEDISNLKDIIKQQEEIEDFAAKDYRGYAEGGIASLKRK